MTRGSLSSHVRKPEEAGNVEAEKKFVAPSSRAIRRAVAAFLAVLAGGSGSSFGMGFGLGFGAATGTGAGCACGNAISSGRAQATVPFRPGMVVTESTRIEPGTYEVAGPESLEEALIIVRGDGIVLDLGGVYLQGIPVEADPDLATGTAIRVNGGTDVTIRNAHIRGYRFGILARGTHNLRLLENELSYNWKPRLFSLIEHESLVDWLSFHANENREWMRFGAAIYLEDVDGAEVTGNRAVQGMNGLLMTRTEAAAVRDNEFAFNSALGIGLYHSSRNTIVGNRLDYNVRGYSDDFYQRGQDSAAILLYAQSSNNVVAYNSATHSGDGLFLWAGQHTMDTGEGGANDNLIFGNDFSFAPTNGVEVTFSRNRIVANRIVGSRYGVWGGYSWGTLIAGNCFAGNEFGIAIEHGQDNHIDRNVFAGDATAVELWANAAEPADWGYPRNRDTRSRDNRVTGNAFAGHQRLWRLQRTSGLEVDGNRFAESVPEEPCVPGALLGDELEAFVADLAGVIPAGEGRTFEVPDTALARVDRTAIVVDEWGPFEWRSPKLWPLDADRQRVRLRVLGPEGGWRLVGQRGVVELSAESGRIGDTLVVTPAGQVGGMGGASGDWEVRLEYVGEATTSPRGAERQAGEAVTFAFQRFEPSMIWNARFFSWSDSARDPQENDTAFRELLATEPLLARSEPRLDYQWFRPSIAELPQERWALEATAGLDLPPGEYSLRTISDDGIRVWVDDVLVIDNWSRPHGSTVDYASLSAGSHRVRVHYYQLGGWTELRVDVVRGSSRSTGSAGPH